MAIREHAMALGLREWKVVAGATATGPSSSESSSTSGGGGERLDSPHPRK